MTQKTFTNDDALFETARELEVDDSSCYSDNDSESEVEVPTSKRQKTCSPLWKISETFSKDITSSAIDKFADLHPELILKTPLGLWKSFVNEDFLEQTLEQTLLYARHDKNCPNFELPREELLQFLA